MANVVILKMMPDANLRAYINIYNMVGACGALLFFLIYQFLFLPLKFYNL